MQTSNMKKQDDNGLERPEHQNNNFKKNQHLLSILTEPDKNGETLKKKSRLTFVMVQRCNKIKL